MNGSRIAREKKERVLDLHKAIIKKSKKLKNLELDVNSKADHRKVMVFYKRNNNKLVNSSLSKSNYENFVDAVDVNAVLIGSSNQSNSTYFNTPAAKGEADIFFAVGTGRGKCKSGNGFEDFLKDISPNDNINKETLELAAGILEQVTISEAIMGKNFDNPEEFLKDILRDLLKVGLK